MKISVQGGGTGFLGNDFSGSGITGINLVSDCKGVVYAWLARKLSPETANSAFRMMTGCKVNKGTLSPLLPPPPPLVYLLDPPTRR